MRRTEEYIWAEPFVVARGPERPKAPLARRRDGDLSGQVGKIMGHTYGNCAAARCHSTCPVSTMVEARGQKTHLSNQNVRKNIAIPPISVWQKNIAISQFKKSFPLPAADYAAALNQFYYSYVRSSTMVQYRWIVPGYCTVPSIGETLS